MVICYFCGGQRCPRHCRSRNTHYYYYTQTRFDFDYVKPSRKKSDGFDFLFLFSPNVGALYITLTHMYSTLQYCVSYVSHTRPETPGIFRPWRPFMDLLLLIATEERAEMTFHSFHGLRFTSRHCSQINTLYLWYSYFNTSYLVYFINEYPGKFYFFTAWHLLPTFEEGNAMCPMRDEGFVMPPRLFEQPAWEISGE